MTVSMLLRSPSKKEAKREENAADFPFLPELVLESVLTRLAPYDICQLAQTCTELRQRCRRDDIWEPLFNKRWGRFIGPAASAAWRRMLRQNVSISALVSKAKGHWIRSLICIWYFSRHGCKAQSTEDIDVKLDESFVNLFWYLENGEFWFPRHCNFYESLDFNFGQNDHVGRMLSCYDAELHYGSNLDTFSSRKPLSSNEIYIPDVAEELRPGDHIEVQWKRSHAFTYRWWYAVVRHADNCISEAQNCECHLNEMVWIEFRQYSSDSKWRRVQLRRNRTQEDGNESDGIYGGIWKSHNKEDICSCYQSVKHAHQSLRSMMMDDGISWIRIRKPPVEISPNELYIPDVAEELRPGDHVEVQWKISHAFSYEWWDAVIGHANNCKSEDQNCKCHRNEMLWLEFRGYGRVQLRRNRTQEDGNEMGGIYGGIRKSHNKEDISACLRMWPKETLK